MKQTAIVGPRGLKAAQVHGVASDLLGCVMAQVPGLMPSGGPHVRLFWTGHAAALHVGMTQRHAGALHLFVGTIWMVFGGMAFEPSLVHCGCMRAGHEPTLQSCVGCM